MVEIKMRKKMKNEARQAIQIAGFEDIDFSYQI